MICFLFRRGQKKTWQWCFIVKFIRKSIFLVGQFFYLTKNWLLWSQKLNSIYFPPYIKEICSLKPCTSSPCILRFVCYKQVEISNIDPRILGKWSCKQGCEEPLLRWKNNKITWILWNSSTYLNACSNLMNIQQAWEAIWIHSQLISVNLFLRKNSYDSILVDLKFLQDSISINNRCFYKATVLTTINAERFKSYIFFKPSVGSKTMGYRWNQLLIHQFAYLCTLQLKITRQLNICWQTKPTFKCCTDNSHLTLLLGPSSNQCSIFKTTNNTWFDNLTRPI